MVTAPAVRRVVSVAEAAEMLGIGKALAYKMAHDGRLPTLLLGERRLVVPIPALDKMLSECGSAYAGGQSFKPGAHRKAQRATAGPDGGVDDEAADTAH